MASATASVTASSSVSLDARVDQRLPEIDDEVDENESRGEHEDDSLQQRNVSGQHRLIEKIAGAGPGEDRLTQHRAADEIAELQAEHRKRLGHDVAHCVSNDLHLRQALGPQRDDEILV